MRVGLVPPRARGKLHACKKPWLFSLGKSPCFFPVRGNLGGDARPSGL
jgi:hypothetical protein